MVHHNKPNPKYLPHTQHLSTNYGQFEVVEYINTLNVIVRFVDTGYVRTTTAKSIRLGTVKDKMKPNLHGVGFIGDGDFKSKLLGRDTTEYNVWRGMLTRCYDVKHKSYKYYGGRGVSVCTAWHNFQNFARWFFDNYPTDGKSYDLDKDVHGAMLYSPSTCVFITHSLNMQIAKGTINASQ